LPNRAKDILRVRTHNLMVDMDLEKTGCLRTGPKTPGAGGEVGLTDVGESRADGQLTDQNYLRLNHRFNIIWIICRLRPESDVTFRRWQ
jgi:hypothetical protein